jgi:hypothetical protein
MKSPLVIFFGALAAAAVVGAAVYFLVLSGDGDITTKRVPGYASPLRQAPQPKCDQAVKDADLPADRPTAPNVDQVAEIGRGLLPNDAGAELYEVFYDVQSETDAKQTRVIWLTKADSRTIGSIDAERTVAGGPWRITAVSSCP